MRARLALVNSAIKIEIREVKLANMPSTLLALSAKATVPVLQLAQSEVIDESLDIMHWALSRSDPDNWLLDRAASDKLIQQNDDDFKPLLDRYKYADRHTQLSQLEHRHNAEFFLQILEARLNRSTYLIHNQVRLADIAILPFIRQFAGVEPGWFAQSEYSSVRNWLNHLIESSLFLSIMHKYSVWGFEDDAIYLEGSA